MQKEVLKKRIKYNAADIIIYTFVGFMGLITLYPFWDCLVVSLSPLRDYLMYKVHLYPRTISFDAYAYIFGMKELWKSYGVTIYITVIGTFINILLTAVTGYVLSKSHLKGQRVIMVLIVFTMMFSGGLIPTYIVVKSLGLMNTLWSLIIPNAIWTYNLIIMKSFFENIPASVEESAKIDGSNDIGILFKIVIPISMPAIATISLFYAVGHWNQFFLAVMYITDRNKWPLQLFLMAMLYENEASYSGGGDNPFLLGMPIKMASIMVAVLPVLCIYPFFQKYFVKGIMLGAVKG